MARLVSSKGPTSVVTRRGGAGRERAREPERREPLEFERWRVADLCLLAAFAFGFGAGLTFGFGAGFGFGFGFGFGSTG